VKTNCNEVVVLQQDGHSSVNRPGKEVTGTRKKGRDRDIGEKEKGSEGAVQERTFYYFPRP